jgi:hypothetical protein
MTSPALPSTELIVTLPELWLPTLIATVGVFVLSMIAWTIAPHHKPEARPLGDERSLFALIKGQQIAPGSYYFPYCDASEMKTDDGKRRYAEGPWGRLVLHAKRPSMGASLLGSFVLYFAVSVALAYLGSETIAAGASFTRVMQVLGTGAVLAYTAAVVPQIIWFDRRWNVFAAHLFDGVVYGLATGAAFGLLWPSAATPV